MDTSCCVLAGEEATRDWKTPSAIVERPGMLLAICEGCCGAGGDGQMLPRQTKRTETGCGVEESPMLESVVVFGSREVWVRMCWVRSKSERCSGAWGLFDAKSR